MCRRRRRRRRLFCLTLSGHRSQWCSIATVLLSLVLSHSFTLWINVCVYFECYEVVFSQTTAFPVIKWGSDSGRRSIVTLLLRLKRWSRMMQVALVCLMLLPFGWPECVQIFISSLAAQWDRSSTQRYFHHIHTHARPLKKEPSIFTFHVNGRSNILLYRIRNYLFDFRLFFLCFLFIFATMNLFFPLLLVFATYHFAFIPVENPTIFWRRAKSTLLLISIQKNANTKTSNHILMWWFCLCGGTNGVEIRAKHTNNGWNLEFY